MLPPAGDAPSPSPPLPRATRRARIALAHDWLVGYRGGEAVLESIAGVVTERDELTRVYTMFDDSSPLSPTIDRAPRTPSWLNSLPLSLRRWALPLYPAAVAHLSRALGRDHARATIDLVISTSSAAIKGLRPPPAVPHICYCHAPARYLWSRADDYARGSLGVLRRIGLGLLGPSLRAWDRRTAANVDVFLANSTYTAGQVRAFYNRHARVIHPPARTGFFTPDTGVPRDGSWLYVGALEPYKRVDVLVAAAGRTRSPLTIVGSGTQSAALRASAGPTVRFTGRISDPELRDHYRRAGTLLMPQIEDFGITAVEAQACGLPVAALRAGGVLDSVVEDSTGVFFDAPTPDAVADAARRALDLRTPAPACRANAERFSEDVFRTAIALVIDEALNR